MKEMIISMNPKSKFKNIILKLLEIIIKLSKLTKVM